MRDNLVKLWARLQRLNRYENGEYVLVRLSMEDSFFSSMAQKNHFVLEHRLVMAKHLKRCLQPWEVVHHKNGAKKDNRLENLMLLPYRKWHLVDAQLKRYIARLERRVAKLEAIIKENNISI